MSKKILLVEDEFVFRAVTAGVLTSANFDVVESCGYPDAVSRFGEAINLGKPFDLIITDYAMVGKNGMDLACYVQSQAPNTPVIIFTAFPELLTPQDKVRVIHKVIRPELFLAEVHAALYAPGCIRGSTTEPLIQPPPLEGEKT